MAKQLTPVFIRLPREQAAALDRMANESGRTKQHLVSELLAQAAQPPRPGPPLLGRIELPAALGRIERPAAAETRDDEVLTLDEAAAMLKLPAAVVRQCAEERDLPARRFGSEWRFSRLAVLAWLADGDRPRDRRSRQMP